ncbi:MAG TPA: GNAT family N-acetyltransferase [Syntrophobacteria bacterium]|nr:GNAT family N-acetyltransferase [Syntrophobacteria bacterium]
MAIRLATREEAPRLAGIIRAAFRDVAERFGLTAETAPTHPSLCTAAWIEKALDKGVAYYVGEDGASVWGCVALERANPDVCYLERLAVLPEFRRKGLGKSLVDHVLKEAGTLGARRVEIGIIATHRELKDWYFRLGFRAIKTVRFEHLPFAVMFMGRALQGD